MYNIIFLENYIHGTKTKNTISSCQFLLTSETAGTIYTRLSPADREGGFSIFPFF